MSDIETLKKIPIFSEMDDQERAGILGIMEHNTYIAGQIILHEAEECQFFHIITSGEVEYIIADAEGTELVLDEGESGSFFGELSMISGEPRSDKVRAKNRGHNTCSR